ncbi:MAG: peptidoglycan binding domain-containing protein, partial [Clostridium sp.]|nr:peptidoglycan binding domain-containing protein [Clostridium sp.]
MGKKAKAGLLACAIAAAGLGGAYVHGAQQYRDRFIDGISINGVDASGKTVDEVEALLKEKTESEYTLDLQFRNDGEETLTAPDIGYEYQSAGKAEKLLRAQNPYDWLSGRMGSTRNYQVDTSFTYDKEALKKSLEALPESDPKNGEEPENAYLVLGSDDRFYIEPDTQGSIISPEGLLEAVSKSLDNGVSEIDVAAVPEAYKTAAVTLDDELLNKRLEDLNSFLNVKATYHMTDGPDEVLDGHVLKDWIKST